MAAQVLSEFGGREALFSTPYDRMYQLFSYSGLSHSVGMSIIQVWVYSKRNPEKKRKENCCSCIRLTGCSTWPTLTLTITGQHNRSTKHLHIDCISAYYMLFIKDSLAPNISKLCFYMGMLRIRASIMTTSTGLYCIDVSWAWSELSLVSLKRIVRD